MKNGTTIYIIYSLVSIFTLSVMSFLFWKRRSATGALSLAIAMMVSAEWTIFGLFSALSDKLEIKIMCDNLSHIGTVLLPVFWFIFSLKYTQKEHYLQKWHRFLLGVVPLITIVFTFSNSLRHFLISNTRVELLVNSTLYLVSYDFNYWYWVQVAYSYILTLAGTILLLQSLIRHSKLYKKQAAIMILAVLIPFGNNILYILGITPSQGFDTTTFSLGVSGIFLFIGMFRFRLLDLVPIARDAVLETMDDLVIVLDTQNRIIDLNTSAMNVFAKTERHILGKHLSDIHEDIHKIIENKAPELKVEERVVIEDMGDIKHYKLKRLPLRNKEKNIIGTFIVMSDMTNLEEMMKNLENAKLAAESANKAKSDFLATMSHEIRTPLNGIIGMSELLKNANLNPEEKDSLSTLQYSADLLLDLINEILDFSKIEAGKMQLENADMNLRQLAENTIKIFTNNNKNDIAFNLNITKDVPEILIGDYVRVRQLLVNLLSNSFKFTERGEIAVEIDTISKSGEEALIGFTVSDTGIGIPEDKIDNLFQNFHQLDSSTTRKYGGTGLGLSIVKKLVELMGGSIQVKSEEGKGSTFSFQIPFKLSEGLIKREPNTETGALECKRKLKILIAEDSKVNQMLMQQYIKKFEWEAVIASNGQIALEYFKENTFDLILMDIQMPEMDGYEATESIRNLEKATNTHIPIVALTANATEADKTKCLECGMDDFLTKPIKSEKLYSCIMKYVS